jgi:hypothetical protein
MLLLPILNQGSQFWNRIANGYVPILKRGSLLKNGEYWQPCSETGIMPRFWLLVVRDSKDRKKYSPHSEMRSPRSVMGKCQKKIQIGESPFQKRVCSKLGINILIPSSIIPKSDLVLSPNSSRDVPISTSPVPKSHIVCPIIHLVMTQISTSPVPKKHIVMSHNSS